MLFNTVEIWLLSSCQIDFVLLVSFPLLPPPSSLAFLISGCFVDNLDNSLGESTLLSESLLHVHASDLDRIDSCVTCDCGDSIFF